VEFETFATRVGANLKKARWSAGLTQEQLAADVLTFRLVAALERGAGNPTLRTLFALSRKLGVSVSELVDVEPVRVGRVPLRERSAEPIKRGRKPKPNRYPKKRSRSTK
jgi:transcriptional regulator with XRE-family HTH domain